MFKKILFIVRCIYFPRRLGFFHATKAVIVPIIDITMKKLTNKFPNHPFVSVDIIKISMKTIPKSLSPSINGVKNTSLKLLLNIFFTKKTISIKLKIKLNVTAIAAPITPK